MRVVLAALAAGLPLAGCQAPTTHTTPTPAVTATLAPGSCHARTEGGQILPDPSCTPGALNPAVTQANIHQTICVSGWTATVRPPASYTDRLKRQQMPAYGEHGSLSSVEEDHDVPLSAGGSPTSSANLWPMPIASARVKDRVEQATQHAICTGRLTLAAAQQQIATDWVALGQALGVLHSGGTP